MEHLEDRKREGGWRDRGTTLEILKACMWSGPGTVFVGEDNLIVGMGKDPLEGPNPWDGFPAHSQWAEMIHAVFSLSKQGIWDPPEGLGIKPHTNHPDCP